MTPVEIGAGAPGRLATSGPLDLLVIQATPFCNLDCRYCYLPDRQNTERMSPTVLDRLFARVFESDVVRGGFTVVWHAGEPLVMPREFYAEAFAIAARHNRAGHPLIHSYQTNATLLDEAWCDFIKRHATRIGVSLDGPAFLHDRQRVTRRGRGTHQRVMDGVARLRRHRIPFHVITVLTLDTLDYPDELYAFYVEHGVERVGFNIEEIEGPHRQSSLSAPGAEQRFRQFLSRFYDLTSRPGSPVRVREFDSMLGAILHGGATPPRTHETAPFAILSVDYRGNFGSFSPELLGLPSRHYGEFLLGNVLADSLEAAGRSPRFAAIHGDIVAGIDRCRGECPYFAFCGGGAPANKYFENGSFDSTETLFCRLNRQAVLDVLLDKLAHPRSPVALDGLASEHGGPDMAPKPPAFGAPRRSRDAPRYPHSL